jgi:putative transcriptional regulator
MVGTSDSEILQSKRSATIYQILVEIAERQPAVSQREIAEEIGVTAQAISDYLQELVGEGYVDKQGRGRYEITKEGVDWLITQTDALREVANYVAEDVLDHVDIETAIATTGIEAGQTVSLTMQEGLLRARSGAAGNATAVAVTDADPGQDVGVTNFEGVIDYELGTVTTVAVPRVQDGGSRVVDPDIVADARPGHDLLAVDSAEGYALARAADLTPDIRFGVTSAVQGAAARGQDVLLLAAATNVPGYADALREQNISYEVVDPVEEG